jgi:hypothetical protein
MVLGTHGTIIPEFDVRIATVFRLPMPFVGPAPHSPAETRGRIGLKSIENDDDRRHPNSPRSERPSCVGSPGLRVAWGSSKGRRLAPITSLGSTK